MDPLNIRFANFVTTMTSFGQIAGLLGLAMFSVNLIISSRLKILDNFFYGLNNMYNFHHKIGAITFSLLLFHPILLVVRYLSLSIESAFNFFLPFYDSAITFGIFSLLLMIILLGITFYTYFKYRTWKMTHKILVLAFIFGLVHSLTIYSDISRDIFIRFYLIILSFAGLGLGLYQSVFSYFINKNLKYTVKKVKDLGSGIVEIQFEKRDRSIVFEAGQFVFIQFWGDKVSSEIHPFSISSAPSKTDFTLSIKSLGDFTSQLKNIEVGTKVSINGPYGKFSYKNVRNKNQIWIGGGIGMTPFLSMAQDLEDSIYNIDLYYCVNTLEEAVYLNSLRSIINPNKKIKIIPWLSKNSGRITAQAISQNSSGLNNKDIFICGPGPFMDGLSSQLLTLGVAKRNIHTEKFSF